MYRHACNNVSIVNSSISHVPARHIRVFLPPAMAGSTHDHAWLSHTTPRDICLENGCRVACLIGLLLLLIPTVMIDRGGIGRGEGGREGRGGEGRGGRGTRCGYKQV